MGTDSPQWPAGNCSVECVRRSVRPAETYSGEVRTGQLSRRVNRWGASANGPSHAPLRIAMTGRRVRDALPFDTLPCASTVHTALRTCLYPFESLRSRNGLFPPVPLPGSGTLKTILAHVFGDGRTCAACGAHAAPSCRVPAGGRSPRDGSRSSSGSRRRTARRSTRVSAAAAARSRSTRLRRARAWRAAGSRGSARARRAAGDRGARPAHGRERLVDGHVAAHSLELTTRGTIVWAQDQDDSAATPLSRTTRSRRPVAGRRRRGREVGAAERQAGELGLRRRAPQRDRSINAVVRIEELLAEARAGLVRVSVEEAAAAGARAARSCRHPRRGPARARWPRAGRRRDPAQRARVALRAGLRVARRARERRRPVVILMCNEGYQSSLAAATLQRLGLSRATDVEGGFQAWLAAGLPVED